MTIKVGVEAGLEHLADSTSPCDGSRSEKRDFEVPPGFLAPLQLRVATIIILVSIPFVSTTLVG